MKQEVLLLIKAECLKIMDEPGFGEVIIKIQNGHVLRVLSTYARMIEKDTEASHGGRNQAK